MSLCATRAAGMLTLLAGSCTSASCASALSHRPREYKARRGERTDRRGALRRHFRFQLRELEGCVLSGEPAGLSHAPVLLGAAQRRRAERELLSHPSRVDVARLGRRNQPRISLLHESAPRPYV